MYYHTCPYCGANLDPDEHCDCLSRIRRKSPKWNSMDGVRARNHKRSGRAALKLGSLFDGIGVFPSPRPAAGLSPRGPVRSPERRYLSPGGISRICCIWAISRR